MTEVAGLGFLNKWLVPSLLVDGELSGLPEDKACQIINIRNPDFMTTQVPNRYVPESLWNFLP